MKATDIIKKLESVIDKHGDVECFSFLHPEQSEGMPEPTSEIRVRDWETPITVLIL